MTPVLVQLEPFDFKTAARVTYRAGSAGEAEAYGLGGFNWKPALSDRPTLSLELMSPEMSGKVEAGRATLTIDLAAIGITIPALTKWHGAAVKIYTATRLAWPAPLEFDGIVTDRAFDLDRGTVTLTAEVVTRFLEKPLLTAEFTGGGGLTGEASKRGVLKPVGFGSCENIAPVWFDTTRWIGMVDGYGNTVTIPRLMEGLNDFGASQGNYASYAALAAAIDAEEIKPGEWATCIAEGLVGLGAPPEGLITVNATFSLNYLGAIMRRILEVHAGIAVGDIDTVAFAALDVAVPRPVRYWTDEQREVKELIEAMAGSANATPLVTFQRKVTVTRAVSSAAVATLDRYAGTVPRILDWRSTGGRPPVWRLKARVARPSKVLTFDEVNYKDTIEEKGLYSGTETYRPGHVVWLANKSSWLYINDAPSAGNAPPVWPATSNVWWQNLTPPITADGVTYADGTPVEDLKPAEAGANVTGTNTAAAIAGQGALATLNAVGTSQITDGSVTVTELATTAVRLGTNIVLADGATSATNALLVTSVGTAAAIAGQGSLATLNAVGSAQITDGSVTVSELNTTAVRLGTNVVRADGSTSVTDAAAITSLGTAAAIAGQGAFATVNSAAYGSGLLTGFGQLAPLNRVNIGSGGRVYREDDLIPLTDATAVTSLGTAAAIAGQGLGATANNLGQLDATANTAIQNTIVNFVSFVNASHITAAFNKFTKKSATGAAASSIGFSNGVSFRCRVTPTNQIQGIILSAASNGSVAYAAGDYGFYLDGTNVRRLTNGNVFIVGPLLAVEELSVTYDARTGTLNCWRGQALVHTETLATGLTFYASWRPGTSTTASIENVEIEPISTMIDRANTIEQGATVTIGEGSLNRNGFGELVDATGQLLAWRVTTGSHSRVESTGATKGRYVMRSSNSHYSYSDVFPVRPGQTLYIDARQGPTLGDDGTAGGTTRFGSWLSLSQDGVVWSDSLINIFSDTTRAAGQFYTFSGSVTLAASYLSGTLIPRYARVYQRFLPTTGNNVMDVDYFDVRDQQLAATIGARSGTNLFRTDGTTVMTQAEVRTAEGVSASIAGQGALATLGQVNLGASGRVYRDNGSTRVTDALAITSLGTAAAITGQQPWATYAGLVPANVAGQVQYLSTGGNLDTLTRVTNRRLTLLLRDDGSTALTEAASITSLGTAAAIAGQGALATLGQVNLGAGGRVYRDDGSTRLTDALAVTALGTAAAISGQGSGATANDLTGLNATEGTKLAGVETGADVTTNAVPRHDPADRTFTFFANNAGVLDGGQLPKTFAFNRMRGATDVSASSTWSIFSQAGISGGTVTVSNGTVTMPTGCAIELAATIVVRSVRDGLTIDSAINLLRRDAPAEPGTGGGTSLSGGIYGTSTTTGYVAISSVLRVKTGSSGELDLAATVTTNVEEGSPAGVFNTQIRWGVKPVGGSYTYETAVTNTSTASVINIGTEFEPEYVSSSGYAASSVTVTGLSANTDYDIVVEGQRTTTSPAKTVYFSGTCSGAGN